ncbi:MAG: NAD(P)/FAD-dependent oxidoreductase [Bacilli bacterium]|nr:NAD(P)/FAD-dependent oxidoreductase [Bacilli bacterium]
MINYDVLIIGGGLSGLTAGSLLAKRGLKVGVIDNNYNPGGSCGIFKRGNRIFDQGSTMLYGFGERGFNAHRFVFNVLEEPIDIIKHDLLYVVNYEGKRIRFWADVEKFADELAGVFPDEAGNIHRFYRDMMRMYTHVMVENPTYTSPEETNPRLALKSMLKHPFSYIKFLSLLNQSAKSLLKQYFKNPEIFNFFDKLTSTYCYATVEEAPAVLAAVMFVDNHVGGSYYPAGSTLYLPGKLEKVIEEHGGDMIYSHEVEKILFEKNEATGVLLDDGTTLSARDIVYTGTVWNFYDKLIDPSLTSLKIRETFRKQVPTYPSVVLYTAVSKSVIPDDTAAIEMVVGNPKQLDESEVTLYIMSIDDKTLCQEDEHIVIAVGPSFEEWSHNKETYRTQKDKEVKRLLDVIERRFPGFKKEVRYTELATPRTIERYCLKNKGAVAGPKQMLGQHMFHRQHIRTKWSNVFCSGESTVMGTGTPTVTTSGLTAANVILRKYKMVPFVFDSNIKEQVHLVAPPFKKSELFRESSKEERTIREEANRCRLCEHPTCVRVHDLDARGIMRRVVLGNWQGAKKALAKSKVSFDAIHTFEERCIWCREGGVGIQIEKIMKYIKKEES